MEEFENNNKKIKELKELIKNNYNKDINDINEYEYNESNIDNIIEKQEKDIIRLNIIVDTEAQIEGNKYVQRIEELKSEEKDLEFSKFYREGIINVNNIDVSVDKFYIKEIQNNEGKVYLNFVCTDSRIDKKIFGSLNDKEYFVKKIHKLKDSMIFYKMYLNKDLYSNNMIVIDNNSKLELFMKHIHSWKDESHKMTAETMV